MTKPYSSHRFIANCFNAGNLKMEVKRVGTRFSRVVTLLFDNMLVQAPEEVGILQADAQPMPISTEPSTSKPQKKYKPKRKHTQEPEVPPTESQDEHNVPLPLPFYALLPSGDDSLKLKELMDFCTNFSNKVLDLESEVIDIKSTYQARIEKLESRVESILDVNDEEPADVEEVLEVVKVAKLKTKVVTTAGVDVNAASVQDTPITTAEATKVSVPRKRRGVIIQDPEEVTTTVTMKPKVQAKGKGKAILIEEPKPLKRQM
nr:hypothetical protein [Tanacetum cinerariifolium]